MATDSGLIPSSPQNDPTLTHYTALLQWMTTHGGHLHPSVQIARDDRRGVHLQVKQDQPPLPSNAEVIHTPLAATLSYFNAIDHRPANSAVTFPAHGVHLPRAFVDAVGPEDTSIFFLVGQYLQGEDGFWAPYLRSLPQPGDLTTPLYYEDGDLEWLGGTSLLAAREQKRVLLRGRYEAGVRELGRAGVEGVERFTWDLYLWASTIFVSRAFSSKVLSGVIPETELPEESVSVLLPFIDVLNHRPLAKVEWRAGKDEVAFLTREDVAAGEEIANNYGPRNNEQLMMNYGFCLSGNPCDYRTVGLRAPPGSPLYVARQHQHQMYPHLATDADDHYYVFNVFYPLLAPDTAMEHSVFSPALFNAVSVLAANNRELETLEISEQGICIPDGYGNSRTILSALSQIIIELITHIMKLKTSAPDSPTPANLKQTHAKVYRDSQILLSETALIIASWTLNRARQHNYRGSWEETKTLLNAHMQGVPAGKFSNEVQSRVQVKILERPSILHDNGELFSADELVRVLLPTEMQDPARVSFQQIATTAERAVPALRDNPAASPFAFPMFLCLVSAAHRNSVRLSSRLGKWVGFLLEHYPPPPEDVLWAVEDEDDEYLLSSFDEALETMREQNETAFSGLAPFTGDWKGDSWWLSPNWLRWAWMAVEQESVQVPENPLGLLSGGAGGQVMLSTVNYLYVPEDRS